MAKFDFRHGIARRQEDSLGNPNNLQKTNGGQWIDLIVSPDPTVFCIAQDDVNYMVTENVTIQKAWGPFIGGQNYWLYWDVDFLTGELTRGFTTLEPVDQAHPPASPQADQHWFDLSDNVMKVWTGSSWLEKLRVFAALYQSGATIIHQPIGSQVGYNGVRANAGAILFDPDGKPLQQFQRNRRGKFITTETPLSGQFARIANFRVESAITQAEAQEHISINTAVAYSDYNKLVVADHTIPERPAIGIAAEDMNTGEVRSFITRGYVTNEADWDWKAHQVGTPLFVGVAGELVTDPPLTVSQQQIGFVVDRTTIFVNLGPVINYAPAIPGSTIALGVEKNTGRYVGLPPGLGNNIALNDLIDVEVPTPSDGDVLIYRTGSPDGWINEPATSTDEFVKASDTDTTTGHLDAKLAAGTGLGLSTLNPGGDEQLEFSLNASLNDLNDVAIGPVVPSGYLLGYNGATWAPVNVSSTAPSSSAGLFVTGITAPIGGIVSDLVYAAGTVPANVVVTEATSDNQTVRVHFLVEGGRSFYSPTVIVDLPTGSPAVGDNVTGILTQDPEDIRTFHGYADITIADGLETGRLIYLEASHGATAEVLIKRAPAPPQIQSIAFDSIYPAVAADPTSGYPGGTQTTIKSGDFFYVSGTVDNSAVLVSLDNTGAVGAGTFTTATAGGSLGAPDSGGVGYKSFTIRFTAGSATGVQIAEAVAQNSFGSLGTPVTTSNTVTMDQVSPGVAIGTINYPAGQQALKLSESATVLNTVSGHDYVYYYENGGAGFINIANPTTYETSKTVTRIGGNYLYNGNNFAIKAYKTSNGTTTTVATGDINISNVAPTVAITGAASRLISSPSGQNYTITLTFSQRLLQAPTIVSSGDPTAGSRGAWSGSGTTWSFTLTVDDNDVKGSYNWTVNNVKTLSNVTYNGVTITSGGTYELGGFTTRFVTIGALEQVVDLGVDITDPTKVSVKYAGTTDLLTYRGSNLSQFQKGWSAVDGAQLIFTPGADPFPNYSNFVFQDPSVIPTSWFFLTDAAFAGSNTTGTLQIEIGEAA